MSMFADEDQFAALFTRLFIQIAETDPRGMDPLVKKRMVIRFVVHEPETEMWVDGREHPVRTTYGTSDLRPTLTAELTGDTLHELLLGTLPLGRSLTRRRMKVKGSKFKALRLESLLHSCQAGYPEIAKEMLADG